MLLIIQIKLTIGACQIFKKEELMQVFATAIVHQRQNIWGIQEHLKLSNRLQIQNIQEIRQYCYDSLSAGQTQSRALCTVQWIGLTTIWKLRINTLIVQVKKWVLVTQHTIRCQVTVSLTPVSQSVALPGPGSSQMNGCCREITSLFELSGGTTGRRNHAGRQD